jgi:adenylate cyclase
VNDNEQFWRAIVTGDAGVMRRERRRHRRIPGAPRCKTCLVPLGGPAAPMVRLVLKRRPSAKNPNYCDVCETFVRTHPGGAEVEISMLFADVRGSSKIARTMPVGEFTDLMQRFYRVSRGVLIDDDAIIEKFVGDEVVGLFVPVLTGPAHASRAVEAAEHLLLAIGHGSPEGPWLPIGAGVHTGTVFVGIVGTEDAPDFTALGDPMNVAAHLASQAAAGEILVTEDAATSASLDTTGLERRMLSLKGHPVDAVVITSAVSERAATR